MTVMTMTVDDIIDGILDRERGYVNHPADKGGPTNFGITAQTLGRWRRMSRAATRAEVKAMTRAEARAIYVAQFVPPWDGYPTYLRMLLIDYGVTTTHHYVRQRLQRALRTLGLYHGPIDGLVGPQTKAAMAAAVPRELYLAVLDERRRHYLLLSFDEEAQVFLATHPNTQLHFCAGWNHRVWAFLADTPA